MDPFALRLGDAGAHVPGNHVALRLRQNGQDTEKALACPRPPVRLDAPVCYEEPDTQFVELRHVFP
jgi:hypothetical protein